MREIKKTLVNKRTDFIMFKKRVFDSSSFPTSILEIEELSIFTEEVSYWTDSYQS